MHFPRLRRLPVSPCLSILKRNLMTTVRSRAECSVAAAHISQSMLHLRRRVQLTPRCSNFLCLVRLERVSKLPSLERLAIEARMRESQKHSAAIGQKLLLGWTMCVASQQVLAMLTDAQDRRFMQQERLLRMNACPRWQKKKLTSFAASVDAQSEEPRASVRCMWSADQLHACVRI